MTPVPLAPLALTGTAFSRMSAFSAPLGNCCSMHRNQERQVGRHLPSRWAQRGGWLQNRAGGDTLNQESPPCLHGPEQSQEGPGRWTEAGCKACQSRVRAAPEAGRAPKDQSSLCPAWQLCPGSGSLPFIVLDLGQPEVEWEHVSMRTEVDTGAGGGGGGGGQGPEKQLCMESERWTQYQWTRQGHGSHG